MQFIAKAVKFAEKNNYWNMQQTETEKQQLKEKKLNKTNLVAFTKCGICNYVTTWHLSHVVGGNVAWLKQNYAINTVHNVSCPNCGIRNLHKVIEQKYLTNLEALELMSKLNQNTKKILSFVEITNIENLQVKRMVLKNE
jgi:hypothetical protein